jgi:2-oxo-4-hydroxy-4-carboxy-5-ureidoimidazoline decarboxylase
VSLAVNDLSHADFVARLGGIYEHSPWVAERAFRARPFASVDALHAAMNAAMHSASHEEKLALIRAHPELLGRLEAARLTESSRGEQAAAGPRSLHGRREGAHAGAQTGPTGRSSASRSSSR